jgi:hypothetical protein
VRHLADDYSKLLTRSRIDFACVDARRAAFTLKPLFKLPKGEVRLIWQTLAPFSLEGFTS